LGLISFSDEMRSGARQTLDAFREAGVQLKIISGDNPATVAALVRQTGYAENLHPVSGLELVEMDPVVFDKTVRENSIFGRITPQQKEQIVKSLQDHGHYVAMIGDGVNDVLALKKANLAIALQGGSQASRSVADLILLDNSFTVLPEVLLEGQRILVGMQDVLKIFLSRITYSALLILASGFAGSFPFTPKHNSLLTLLTVGLPTLALAVWAKPGFVRSEKLIRKMVHFVLPAGLTLSLAGLFVFMGYLIVPMLLTGGLLSGPSGELDYSPAFLPAAQTAITSFSIFCGLLLLVFAEPPSRFWVGGERLSSDHRPAYLALFLFGLYAVILSVPMLRKFFELSPIGIDNFVLLVLLAGLWALALRWVWRTRILDRFLSLSFDTE
jgi:cation-transporting ATPase E